ncbi:hypothetical protein SAMN05720472_0310 [Fibrobacter sp. UWR3]|nr:hypothetical protein SAMN05720472_0310 [Fibrobacter sp. UWR3]
MPKFAVKIHLSSLAIFILVVWALLRSTFFEYVGVIPYKDLIGSVNKIFTFFVVLLCVKKINFREHKIPSLLFVGCVASFLCNELVWNSPFIEEFFAYAKILGFFSYFLLLRFCVKESAAELFLIVFAVIYFFCWVIGIVSIPDLVFGADRDSWLTNTDRGFYRLFIPNKEHFTILLFFFLGKFFNNKKSIFLILSMLSFVVIVLHVGRQWIFWAAFFVALMIGFGNNWKKWKILLILVIVSVACYAFFEANPQFGAMVDVTQKQMDNANDDIRMQAIDHYLWEYPHNLPTMIWGNGPATSGTELRTVANVAFNRGFYKEDIGFVAMYVDYGLWMVFLMIALALRVVRIKVEPKYVYLKFYIFTIYGMYLFAHSLTTNIFYVMIAYFILEKSALNLRGRNEY